MTARLRRSADWGEGKKQSQGEKLSHSGIRVVARDRPKRGGHQRDGYECDGRVSVATAVGGVNPLHVLQLGCDLRFLFGFLLLLLQLPHMGVVALPCQQLCVPAALDDPALIHHQDLIGIHHRA